MGFVSQQEQAASGVLRAGAAAVPGPGPAPARVIFAGRSGGMRWAVRAGRDGAGRLATVLTRTWWGGAAASGVPGSPPRDGQLVSMWISRGPRTPAFLLLRAAPEVTRVTALLASGTRRRLALSPVIDDLRLRFAAALLPEEDPLAAVEAASGTGGTRTIEMWRPPIHAPDRALAPAATMVGTGRRPRSQLTG
jgi:hypothetical protein